MTDVTKKERVIARLTIEKPGKMSDKERGEISYWLSDQAFDLVLEGDNYTEGRFVARYYERSR